MALMRTDVPRREVPWLGIGTRGEWYDYRDALEASDMAFTVVPRDAKVEFYDPLGTGFGEAITWYDTVPGVQVNVQLDNNRILGCVSSQYGIIQNNDAFSLLEPLTNHGAVITHAGMTEQGLCFMIAEWSNFTVTGDEYKLYIMATNSFNGSYPCGLIITPVRIFCQNMYRKLMRTDNLLHIRHMSLAQQRIEEAKFNVDKISGYITCFDEIMEHAMYVTLTKKKQEHLLETAFTYPKNEEAERFQSSKERVDRLREEFCDVYLSANDIRKYAGTASQFIHAWYDYLSHGEQSRRMSGNWDHKRFSRLVSGKVNTNVVKEALK